MKFPGVFQHERLFSFVVQQVNVTRAGCGVTALCVDQPGACDPAGNGTCLFASVVAGPPAAPNGTDLYFKLRGTSKGYVALGLAVNATEVTHVHLTSLMPPPEMRLVLEQGLRKTSRASKTSKH